ncbi:hypothetical protein PFISCL1PPCAC_6559, partial [Pristionchus fissidentatus]
DDLPTCSGSAMSKQVDQPSSDKRPSADASTSTNQSNVAQSQHSLIWFDSKYYLPLFVPLLHIDLADKDKMFNKVGLDHLRQVFCNDANRETIGQVIMTVSTLCSVCEGHSYFCETSAIIRHIFSPKHMNAYLKKRSSVSYKDFSFWQRLFKLFPPGHNMVTKNLYEEGLPVMARRFAFDLLKDRFFVLVSSEDERIHALLTFISASIIRSFTSVIYYLNHKEIAQLSKYIKKEFPGVEIKPNVAGQVDKEYLWMLSVHDTTRPVSSSLSSIFLRPPGATDAPIKHAMCAMRLGTTVTSSLMLIDSGKEQIDFEKFHKHCVSSPEIRPKLSTIDDLLEHEKKWKEKAAEAPPPDPKATVPPPTTVPSPRTDSTTTVAPPTKVVTTVPKLSATVPSPATAATYYSQAAPALSLLPPVRNSATLPSVSKPSSTVPSPAIGTKPSASTAAAAPKSSPPSGPTVSRLPPVPYPTTLPTAPKAVAMKLLPAVEQDPEPSTGRTNSRKPPTVPKHLAQEKTALALKPKAKVQTTATVPATADTMFKVDATVPATVDISKPVSKGVGMAAAVAAWENARAASGEGGAAVAAGKTGVAAAAAPMQQAAPMSVGRSDGAAIKMPAGERKGLGGMGAKTTIDEPQAPWLIRISCPEGEGTVVVGTLSTGEKYELPLALAELYHEKMRVIKEARGNAKNKVEELTKVFAKYNMAMEEFEKEIVSAKWKPIDDTVPALDAAQITVHDGEVTVPPAVEVTVPEKETVWVQPEMTTNPKYLTQYNEDGSEKWSRSRLRVPKCYPDIFIPFTKEEGEAVAKMMEQMKRAK